DSASSATTHRRRSGISMWASAFRTSTGNAVQPTRSSTPGADGRQRAHPTALELLQRPPRRRSLLPGLSRAAHVPALSEDGRRVDTRALESRPVHPEGARLAELESA